MSRKSLFIRVCISILAVGLLIFFVIVKQKSIIRIRTSEVVSPINEWAKSGKPVDIMKAKKATFFTFSKLTVEKDGKQYIGYITQDEKEALAVGQSVYSHANTKEVYGKVLAISPERDIKTGLFKVSLDLSMAVHTLNGREIVFIQTGAYPNVIQLPNEVIDTDGTRNFVNTVVNGKLKRIYVQLGICGRETTIIDNGVNEGDLIVVRGGALVDESEGVFVRKELAI